ncbi:helix-turn-helix domain-containing protein [Tanticharoenia sakaeratensis]|uniref:Cytoskeleton protein RodZ-like C-terminal domain-containing protein n=1 Tax=Tanticharoenia sakaeratensis NBRC 103193 TaxID=1231623 RepID=A0A0D6MNU9_9PROT|nr:helix-turn-helix domain-containing protein [Tanticharoenia sakaeratensis]GAN54963.1 hypothetical protein Tasa_034_047 [Tanticharoenia sakaeratensis NBRC 103193]
MKSDARPNRTPSRPGGRSPNRMEGPREAQAIGAELRARREQLGWALLDIANWLRIRLPHLEALEEGRVEDLPGAAYAVGFLKTYAGALGFDGEEMAQRFSREAGGALHRKPELSFPAPEPDRSIPVSVRVASGLVVVVIAYVVWYRTTGHQVVPSEHVPSVAEVMPGVTSHGTASPQVASVLPEPGHAPTPRPVTPPASGVPASGQGSAPPLQPHVQPPVASPSVPAPGVVLPREGAEVTASGAAMPNASAPNAAANGSEGANTPVPPLHDETSALAAGALPQAPVPPTTPAPSVPTTTPPAPPAADAPTVSPDVPVIHASADSWLSVRDAQGHMLVQRVLKAGETWMPPADSASDAVYRVTVGNAGGITLSVGSTMTGPLGRSGAVVRGLPVSADAIRSGHVVPQSGAPKPASDAMPPAAAQ